MAQGVRGRKIFFIINPKAGGGHARDWWQDIRPELDAAAYDYFWQFTENGREEQQIREAIISGGAQAIVAVGGDGSLYHAINGMVENDALLREDMLFVVAPIGSSCDFGRFFYDGRQKKADFLRLLAEGEIRRIDLGRCFFPGNAQLPPRVKYFINSFDAGAGADACVEVNAGGGRLKKFWRGGRLAFLLASLKVLMTFTYTEARIELPERIIKGEYIIIGIGNGKFAGGGMMLFPRAALDDGLLDLLLVPRKGRLEILRVFSRVYRGTILGIQGIVYHQVKEAKISAARPLFVEMDGEVPGQTDVELRVLPAFLPILGFAPADS
ncbi:MAG: YegS/Rv2252/BmrU family lipid kinase [Clostridia bacterium]|nr:YegS/Rv2252/BmrU family lipid kinase [Clostridia bacterium]